DYTATGGTLTFAPGQTSQTFAVPITDDTLAESDETVQLALSNPSGATLGMPSAATLTIQDNDSTPLTVAFSSSSYTVAEGGGQATVTVALSQPSMTTVTVHYPPSLHAALPVCDYTATGGTLTFGPGQTSRTFSVPITDDTLVESDET